MIDFRKPIVRINKFTVKEGDFYLKDISSAKAKDLSKECGFDDKEKGGDIDKFYQLLIGEMLCDDKGKELRLTEEELANLPKSLIKDLIEKVNELTFGKKKD